MADVPTPRPDYDPARAEMNAALGAALAHLALALARSVRPLLSRVLPATIHVLSTAIVTTALILGSIPGCPQPQPGPGPTPDPGPAPGPAPTPVKIGFLLGITDNDNRTQDLAAVLGDHALSEWLKSQGIAWRVMDKDQAAYKDSGYPQVLAAAGKTPPAMIAVGTDGSKRVGAAPATSDDVKAFVAGKKAGGDEDGFADFIEVDGHKRYLGLLHNDSRRFAKPKGGEWKDVKPIIPRDKWRKVDRRASFPPAEWVYDQDGIGSCVAEASTCALRKILVLAGMKDVRLAPGCTYAQINGGHDSGAVISDSLTALQNTGTITSATLGSDQKPFYLNRLPAGWKDEAKRFRIEEAYHASTFDEVASGIQCGFVACFGIQVGNNWGRFDQYGVCGHDRGPGNHAVHADGMDKLPDGRWVLDMQNSWGADWGPWKNGRAYQDEKHFQNGDQPDAYLVKAATEDPQEPIKPPKLSAAKPVCNCTGHRDCGCDKYCPCANCVSAGVKKSPRKNGGYCSDGCSCGCNDGQPCRCDDPFPQALLPSPRPAVRQWFAPRTAPMPRGGGGC